MTSSDLQITRISDSLAGKTIDLIVSGSIGAVESVRFIRSLRRLGAQVRPFLTQGGQRFITETSLSWAAAGPVILDFSGTVPHISDADACVIAPASANIISAIAHGVTSSPATAVIASHLGVGKPVILVPSMHDSMFMSPAIRENIEKIRSWVTIVESRKEEGKQKFPDPETLADEVSHVINQVKDDGTKSLITMGSTQGYIDAVRYVSNYSSGRLGSLIAEELYRLGHHTAVVAGPCKYLPRCYSKLLRTKTNSEMVNAIDFCTGEGIRSAIMAASVLDYIPANKFAGKLKSSADRLVVEMLPTPKIISQVNPRSGIKVGFKLEFDLDEQRTAEIIEKYFQPQLLSMLVINVLKDVSEDQHRAIVIERTTDSEFTTTKIDGKETLANHIAHHVSRLEHC